MTAGDVHAQAREVLDFWFALTPEQHFAKSDSLDATIAGRFGPLLDAILATEAAGWRDTPRTLLAAVIVLDQFARNMRRGTAGAFAGDALAQSLTLHAIEQHWDETMPQEQKHFLYMPLMHAEDRALQSLSIAKFATLGDETLNNFARDHAVVVERFGRYPTRNAALGRTSSPEEEEYLRQPGVGW